MMIQLATGSDGQCRNVNPCRRKGSSHNRVDWARRRSVRETPWQKWSHGGSRRSAPPAVRSNRANYFAGLTQAAFAQPAGYRTVIRRGTLHGSVWTSCRPVAPGHPEYGFAGASCRRSHPPLQKLAIPLGQAAVGHRACCRQGRGPASCVPRLHAPYCVEVDPSRIPADAPMDKQQMVRHRPAAQPGRRGTTGFHMISLVYSSSAASGAVTERLTLRRRWPAG